MQTSDGGTLNERLNQAILNGLGTDDPVVAWEKLKAVLRQDRYGTDIEMVNGKNVISALTTGSLEKEIQQIINLCSDFDNGFVLLRNACKIFRSLIYRKEAENILQIIAEQLPNQPAFRTHLMPIAPMVFVDLTWIDDLNQTSFKPARRVVEAMSRPGEPLALDDIAKQFLDMLPYEDFKSALKQILGNKPKSVIDDFQKQLTIREQVDNQTESIQFLFIFIEEAKEEAGKEVREPLFRYKAELVEQGETIPLSLNSERENNGTWPVGSIRDLPAHIVYWHGVANKRAGVRLSMEVFLPNRVLEEFHDFQIEIVKRKDESNSKTLNLIFDCPFVLRSSDRAVSAQKGELGPLKRKWQSLLRGDSVLHSLTDDSELEQNTFHALLNQDFLAGILILKNLPEDESMRSHLIKRTIETGTPLLAWFHDIPKNDSIESTDYICERLTYFDRCLNLDGVQRDDLQRIKAPVHLCETELAAQKRFELATQTDCESWIHRVNIFLDHPDRWPQLILYEHQLGGEIRTDVC